MADRWLTVFTFEVEAVHEHHPAYFADLVTADLNEAMRRRGLHDARMSGVDMRVIVAPHEMGPVSDDETHADGG
jgi:hypothetical protein